MLLPTQTSPLDEVWVSLDLETTGLSFDSDEIIEVGAVKFKGDETIDTFHSLVNPYRDLDSFVRRYTGINPGGGRQSATLLDGRPSACAPHWCGADRRAQHRL